MDEIFTDDEYWWEIKPEQQEQKEAEALEKHEWLESVKRNKKQEWKDFEDNDGQETLPL